MVGGKVVHGAGDFASLAPPLPPAMPGLVAGADLWRLSAPGRADSSRPGDRLTPDSRRLRLRRRVRRPRPRPCQCLGLARAGAGSQELLGRPRLLLLGRLSFDRATTWSKRIAVAAALVLPPLVEGWADEPARPTLKPLRQDEDWSVLCDPACRTGLIDRAEMHAPDRSTARLGSRSAARCASATSTPTIRSGATIRRTMTACSCSATCCSATCTWVLTSVCSASSTAPSRTVAPAPPARSTRTSSTCSRRSSSCRRRLPEDSQGMLRGRPAGAALRLRTSGRRARGAERPAEVRRRARPPVAVATGGSTCIAARPADDEPGVFDDGTNGSQALWGALRHRPIAGLAAVRQLARPLLSRLPQRRRHLRPGLGPRDAPDGRAPGSGASSAGWDWNWELIGQAGEFGRGDIRAWSVASDTGYTWREAALTPRLGLSANIASGDTIPTTPICETFNPLYPRGNYFSELALLGPRNFYNLHPFLTVNPTDRLSITSDVDFFWRLRDRGRDLLAERPAAALRRRQRRPLCRHGDLVQRQLAGHRPVEPHRRSTRTSSPGASSRRPDPRRTIDYVELTLRFQF